MEIPNPTLDIQMGGTSTTVVLPHVLTVSSGLAYVEAVKVPIVTITLRDSDPVVVQLDSPADAQALAGNVRANVSMWHLYCSMGPVLYQQIMVPSTSGDDNG